MRILLTGASSFTGWWFARALVAEGHQLTVTFQRKAPAYTGLEGARLADLPAGCTRIHGVSFGDDEFIVLAGSGFDLVCHHGARVQGYCGPDFDVGAALAANTLRAPQVLRAMADSGCPTLLVTGSVFESGEGQGDAELRAIGSYGLSKAFTWQTLAHHAAEAGIGIAKFVIPNPFGPYESERFMAHLMRAWMGGQAASVTTPNYVHDHVHASALAASYAGFAGRVAGRPGVHRLGPSGYRESVGAFARRTAFEVAARTGLKCRLELADQTTFQQPRLRVNTDRVELARWSEAAAWDELVHWYGARPALQAAA